MKSIAMLFGTVLALALACSSPPMSQQELTDSLELALTQSDRSDADKARDAGRKPAQVIAFLGIEPGMQVIDLIAAGGWYSEVLSVAVGPKGRVYAQNPEVVLKFREGANDKAMTARLQGNRLPNVIRLDQELAEVDVKPGSLDAAVTALNYHDVHNSRGADAGVAFLRTVLALLKPGGTLGIIDHVGGVGSDKELHRISQPLVERAARDAGFELVATSELLRSRSDNRQESVFAPHIRGRTDRFVLRLRRPL